MTATLLTTKRVEKPWGRRDLWPAFESVAEGGKPVGEIWFEVPGEKDGATDGPPLLIKYLFTSDRLSVKVHPNDAAADVAVTVVDEWQGRGAASALLAELMENRQVGVRTIRTQVSAGNQPSLAMLRRLGDLHLTQAVPGVYDVQVDLEQPAGATAEHGQRS